MQLLKPTQQQRQITTCKQVRHLLHYITNGLRQTHWESLQVVSWRCLSVTAAFKELCRCSYDFTIWASPDAFFLHVTPFLHNKHTNRHTHTHTHCIAQARWINFNPTEDLTEELVKSGHWALPVPTCLSTSAGYMTSSCKARKSHAALMHVSLHLGCK